MCSSNRDDRTLENTVKADSNTWESFTRSELKLESVHQESPRSDIFRKRATKPLLKQKHRQKHLTWAKEKNNWTVVQWSKVLFSDESTFLHFIWKSRSGGREERHSIHVAWSPVWSFHSQWWFGLPCWCWSTVFSEVLSQRSHRPGHFRSLHASFCWQALWRCWFHFPAGLAHTAKDTKSQFNDHGVTVLDWPANSPDLNPRESRWETPDPTMQMTWTPENLDERHQTQQCRWPEPQRI